MTAKQIIERLKKEGWRLARQKGSHKQFKHPEKQILITVPDHGKVDLRPGTQNDIFKKAGWK
ncbi:MAG: type II toxin-antitoxin system HicA family toxin [SAR324 cluster bacterium]|nr:type II toxin-antitoxin system HicA family toxin [SAR324 cluster bacterium]